MRGAFLMMCLAAFVLGVSAGDAPAGVTRTWISGSGDWFQPSNWSPNGIPAQDDTLSVLSGSPVASSWVHIDDGGSIGIAGPGQGWFSDLFVGETSSGTLAITGGGTVSNTWAGLGQYSSGIGTMTVEGAGSTYTSSHDLEVGSEGTGTLTITSGGAVSNRTTWIGYSTGADGTVTVTGAGSTWTNSSYLDVGRDSTGALTISNGGAVSNQWAHLGEELGATGTVTVDGAGSTLTNSGGFTVGDNGTGTLAISSGGAVSDAEGSIGAWSGSNGAVTVDGAGSTWTNSGNLYVGFFGTGTLTLSNGGAVSNGVGDIGYGSGSSGTVTVEGAGSTWTNSASLSVGNSSGGAGSLTVQNGGEVNVGGTLKVWGAGTVNLNGDGLIVADEVELVSGATFNTAGECTLRVNTLTGFGDHPSVAGSLQIGHAGGSGSGSHSVGAGQSLDAALTLTVGYSANGTLTIQDGASVSNSTGTIGLESPSSGTVTVEGAGSTWTNSTMLYVGHEGTGTLTVTNGGAVWDTMGAYLGARAGGMGTVTVDGAGSTWSNSGNLSVGGHGTGTLTISDGGAVSNGIAAYIGYGGGGSIGTVTVEGSGSTWTNSGKLYVAFFGTGTLSVTSGAAASNTDGYIGHYLGATGTATVDGAGSSWTNSGSLYVGGRSGTAGGTGELTIQNDGGVSVASTLKVWGAGTVNLTGGTLAAGSIDHTAGGAFNFTGGRLHVGTFVGDLVNWGGTVAPGGSAGTTIVQGSYIQTAAGTLEIELGGLAPGSGHDKLNISGPAALGGTLAISLISDFTPQVSDEFEIMTYAFGTGEFADTTGWLFDGNKALVKVYGANALTLVATYQGDATLDFCVDGLDYVAWSNNYLTGDTWDKGDFNDDGTADGLDYVIWSNNYRQGCPGAPGPVPEPGTLALLAMGAAALIRRRRK